MAKSLSGDLQGGYRPTDWRAAQRAPEGELDLHSLGSALWAKRLLILALTLGVMGLAFIVTSAIAPRYTAETRVLIEQRDNPFLRPDADTSTERTAVDIEAVTSQVQLIQSRDLALDVIRQLKLTEKPEFDPVLRSGSPLRVLMSLVGIGRDPMSMTPEERVLRSYYERLKAFAVDRSRVITIEFDSEDPALAAQIANTIAETYLRRQQEAKQGQNRSAGQYLAREIESLRSKVAEAEGKVEEFRGGTSLLVGNNGTTLANQQLGDFNAQVAAVRGQKADSEGKAKLIRETLKSGKPIEFNDIVNSELIRRLSEQRVGLHAQLAEQSSTLLDLHPRIKELRAQIGNLEQQMRQEAERIARSLENEATMAASRLESMVAGLDQLKKTASATNSQDVQLRALERDAKSQRDLLESYLGRYREATARDSIEATSADARVISRAVVSSTPSWPKKTPTVLVAGLIVLVLTIGFILTAKLLDSGSDSRPVVVTRAPTLARAPTPARIGIVASFRNWMNKRQQPVDYTPVVEPSMTQRRPPQPAPAAAVSVPPVALPSGSIETLAQELRASGEEGRRITVMGTSPGIGSAAAAISLARNLSRQAKVVLVDLALGSPHLAAIAADPAAPGIADLVRGTASFGQILTRDRNFPIHLVLAGTAGLDSGAILASHRLTTTLEALARAYDHVVIAAGPLAETSVERLAALAPRAVLIAPDLDHPLTVAARERILNAGFVAVTVLVAGPQTGSDTIQRAA